MNPLFSYKYRNETTNEEKTIEVIGFNGSEGVVQCTITVITSCPTKTIPYTKETIIIKTKSYQTLTWADISAMLKTVNCPAI